MLLHYYGICPYGLERTLKTSLMIHGSRTRLNMADCLQNTSIPVRHKELWVQTVHSKHMSVRTVQWLTTSLECRRTEVRNLVLTLCTDDESV